MKCAAVDAEDIVYKCDHKNFILKNLTSFIEAHSFYGLIGPSGCGKTTFLHCIIGLIRPTSGSLKIFGKKRINPREIGYMPQELCLYPDLTIEQTVTYYARLNMLTLKCIREKIQQLMKFLNLVDATRLVGKLSSGQQRRISFMCAVIHQPKLLILDEPTVGCDPVIREAILSYLISLKSKKTTTVITTHYIEETRKCDSVGFMRNGRILLEGNPHQIMKTMKTTELENVFVVLCKDDDNGKQTIRSRRKKQKPDRNDIFCGLECGDLEVVPLDCGQYISKLVYNIIKYFFIVNILCRRMANQAMGYKSALLSYFFSTCTLLLLWTLCYGLTPQNLIVGVVIDEIGTSSWNTIEEYNLYSIIKFKNYSSVLNARSAIERGEIHGYLHMEENFTQNIVTKISDFYNDEDNDDDEEGKFKHLPTQLTYYPSGVNPIELHAIRWTLDDLITNAVPEIALRVANLKNFSLKLIAVEELFGKFDYSDMFNRRQIHIPSAMIFACHVTTLVYFASFFFYEITAHNLQRLSSSGVSNSQIFISCMVVNFSIICVIFLPIFVLPLVFFNIHVKGSLVELTAIQLLCQAATLLTCFLLSTIRVQLNVVLIIINGYLFSGMFVTGLLTSWESIPYYVKSLKYFYPYFESRDAAFEIIMKGNSIENSSSLKSHFINIITYSVIVYILIMMRLKYLTNK